MQLRDDLEPIHVGALESGQGEAARQREREGTESIVDGHGLAQVGRGRWPVAESATEQPQVVRYTALDGDGHAGHDDSTGMRRQSLAQGGRLSPYRGIRDAPVEESSQEFGRMDRVGEPLAGRSGRRFHQARLLLERRHQPYGHIHRIGIERDQRGHPEHLYGLRVRKHIGWRGQLGPAPLPRTKVPELVLPHITESGRGDLFAESRGSFDQLGAVRSGRLAARVGWPHSGR